MQVDLLAELQSSVGYENIITANDILSRLVFAYPVSSVTAVDTVKVVIDIMTPHAYLPDVTIADKRSIFVSIVIQEIADVLGITLRHATTKHAKTVAVLERTHARVKTSHKMSWGQFCKSWHEYLTLLISKYNTKYQRSIGSEPSRTIRGQVPYDILDHKLGQKVKVL